MYGSYPLIGQVGIHSWLYIPFSTIS